MPNPTRIWIVEDSLDYRMTLLALASIADDIDFIQAFDNGEGALEMAEESRAVLPDVVLMDISLPGLSGLETTQRLKAVWPTVQIVMLTNRDEPELMFSAMRCGASGYLLKDSPAKHIFSVARQAAHGAMLLPAPVARKIQQYFATETHTPSDYDLSQREEEVLQQMTKGLSQKRIADVLFISRSTVNSHIQRIYEKLHVNSASAAVAKAMRERLV